MSRPELYCATCAEWLSAKPLDADVIVMLIHAMGGHQVELKTRDASEKELTYDYENIDYDPQV